MKISKIGNAFTKLIKKLDEANNAPDRYEDIWDDEEDEIRFYDEEDYPDPDEYPTYAEYIFREKVQNGELEEDDYEALNDLKREYSIWGEDGEWDEIYDEWRD